MKANEQVFSVAAMASVLSVSRSGYYDWRKRSVSDRVLRQVQIDHRVQEEFKRWRERHGAPRLAYTLKAAGFKLNRKTVAYSLARQGLVAKAGRKFKATTNSSHNLPVAPNLLGQDFEAEAANRKWAGDITYLWTEEGWLYLAVVLDLYSRQVIGWAMSPRMKAELACEALENALKRRGNPSGVIVHTDRGSQYCSIKYQKIINKHDLKCSMSRKGDCYDNACVESFFHSMKVEAIHGERVFTRQDMTSKVFEYIETYYNRERLHSTCGYISPQAFEEKNAA